MAELPAPNATSVYVAQAPQAEKIGFLAELPAPNATSVYVSQSNTNANANALSADSQQQPEPAIGQAAKAVEPTEEIKAPTTIKAEKLNAGQTRALGKLNR